MIFASGIATGFAICALLVYIRRRWRRRGSLGTQMAIAEQQLKEAIRLGDPFELRINMKVPGDV